MPRSVSRSAAVVLRAARPRQWVKNLLVLLAPAGAGVLFSPGNLFRLAVLFVAFSLVASGMYVDNDLRDVSADTHDPRKRSRPVVSGELPPGFARRVSFLFIGTGLVTSLMLSTGAFLALGFYVVHTAFYSRRLKHVPYVEMFAVSSGFLVRALAGALVTGAPLRGWFLPLVFAVAFFVVLVKRSSELGEGVSQRRVLAAYTVTRLAHLRRASLALAVVVYAGWALTRAEPFPAVLSMLPLGAALLRVEGSVSSGRGAEPDQLVFSDRLLLFYAITWFTAFLFAVG